ncbi:hypothetical protein R1sor_015253 [Riccia sorocarpa]|uniref:RING-type domain-containing protein n=1 Tax=Riccia sorocarpa TaxID=122646 RepID=A0ABD3HFK9_9MARC
MEEKNVSSGEGLKCPVTATTESISPSIEQRESKVECLEDEDKKKGEVRDDSETSGTSQTKKTDWAEEEFWKPIEYFADDCNLPNEGLMPNDVPKTLVSDEVLLECFGPKCGKNGRNGPKLSNCTGLPQEEVLHLFQVIDGHDKPVNGTLGAIFPRALYAKRVLGKKINWAAYAHEKLKNQIKTSKLRGDPKPTGPPYIRTHRVYIPPVSLSPTSSVEKEKLNTSMKVMPDSTSAMDTTGLPIGEGSGAGGTDAMAFSALSSSVITDEQKIVTCVASAIRSTMPGIEYLKREILDSEEKGQVTRDEIDRLRSDITKFSEQLDIVQKLLSEVEKKLREKQQLREDLEIERSSLMKKKCDIELQLNDGVFDDENPERTLASIDSTVKVHSDELSFLNSCIEGPTIVLAPRFIPTATELNKTIFRLSSCPVCTLGFHCHNFMATPCGHAYHPACLLPILAKKENLECLQCKQSFHPHWCEAWGIEVTAEHKSKREERLDLEYQRKAFEKCLLDFYQNQPEHIAERRRDLEEKRNRFTVMYTPEKVENSWVISTMTANQYNVGTSPAQSTVAIKSKYSRDYEKEGKLVISTIPTVPRGKDVEERVSNVSVIDVPVGRLPTTRSSSKRGKPSNLKTSENVESHRKVRTGRNTMSVVGFDTGTASPGSSLLITCVETSWRRSYTVVVENTEPATVAILDFKNREFDEENDLIESEGMVFSLNNQMTSDYQTSFFGRVKILKYWGPLEGQFTYAACGGSLKDGRPCGLGVAARMARDQMSSSQMSTQTGTPGSKSRDRSGHTCVPSGADKHMYHFFVQIASPDVILEVWEKAGQDLFGITASVTGKPLRGFQRVNSFHCAELGSPVKASACGESQPGASACVGVVTIGDFLDESAMSESSSFSSTRQRDSLAALLRLQSRLNKMEEELAKAIAALKLEQESELVERNCHWVVKDTH